MIQRNAIFVASADHHTNDHFGLNPPKILLDSGLKVLMPRNGLRLYNQWVHIWEYIAERKRALDAIVYHFQAGDLGDLNSHSQDELITLDDNTVLDAMVEVNKPAKDVADYQFVLRGTKAHVGSFGHIEEAYAKTIGAMPDDVRKTNSWRVFNRKIHGRHILAVHNCKSFSSNPRLQNAAMLRFIQKVVDRRSKIEHWYDIPEVIFAAHNHYSAYACLSEETDLPRASILKNLGRFQKEQFIYGYQLPPMKLVGTYGLDNGAEAYYEPVGLVMLEQIDGHITNHGKPAFIWRFPQGEKREWIPPE